MGKNGLTEKELYCLAWHFKHFWPAYTSAGKEKMLEPCLECKHFKECTAEGGISHHLDMIHTLENLLEIKVLDKDTF